MGWRKAVFLLETYRNHRVNSQQTVTKIGLDKFAIKSEYTDDGIGVGEMKASRNG